MNDLIIDREIKWNYIDWYKVMVRVILFIKYSFTERTIWYTNLTAIRKSFSRFGLLVPIKFSVDLFHMSFEIALSITRETTNFARVRLISSVSDNVPCNGLDASRLYDFRTKWTTPVFVSNLNWLWFLKHENAKMKQKVYR